MTTISLIIYGFLKWSTVKKKITKKKKGKRGIKHVQYNTTTGNVLMHIFIIAKHCIKITTNA